VGALAGPVVGGGKERLDPDGRERPAEHLLAGLDEPTQRPAEVEQDRLDVVRDHPTGGSPRRAYVFCPCPGNAYVCPRGQSTMAGLDRTARGGAGDTLGRRLRETGPALLVPLAWGFAAAAHAGALDRRAVLIGHLVMATLLAAFAVASRHEMRGHPVLRAWLAVIVAGFFVTLGGAVALAAGSGATPLRATVVAWMLLPAAALLYTGNLLPRGDAPLAYTVGGLLSTGGALVLVAAPLAGPTAAVGAIVLAGVGQTAGILAAVVTH